MVPGLCVIRSHKKKIESSPSMIFPQGMVTTTVFPSAHTISNNSMSTCMAYLTTRPIDELYPLSVNFPPPIPFYQPFRKRAHLVVRLPTTSLKGYKFVN